MTRLLVAFLLAGALLARCPTVLTESELRQKERELNIVHEWLRIELRETLERKIEHENDPAYNYLDKRYWQIGSEWAEVKSRLDKIDAEKKSAPKCVCGFNSGLALRLKLQDERWLDEREHYTNPERYGYMERLKVEYPCHVYCWNHAVNRELGIEK